MNTAGFTDGEPGSAFFTTSPLQILLWPPRPRTGGEGTVFCVEMTEEGQRLWLLVSY